MTSARGDWHTRQSSAPWVVFALVFVQLSLSYADSPKPKIKPKAAATQAASKPVSDATKDLAKKYATDGKQKYKVGKFPEALAAYSKAYELFPAPALLFNLGQCEKNLGHHERAIFFFEGYLRDEQRPEARQVAQDLINESEASLTKQRQEEASAAAAQRAEEERQQQIELEKERALANAPGLQRPVEPPKPLIKRPWFWTVIGLGAVAVGVGIGEAVYWSQAPKLSKTTLGTVEVQ